MTQKELSESMNIINLMSLTVAGSCSHGTSRFIITRKFCTKVLDSFEFMICASSVF